MPVLPLAAVLVLVGILVLILIAVLVGILITVLIAVLILILVLVIHSLFLRFIYCGHSAYLVCPEFQALSLALKRKLASKPAKMAAVMPPAAAFSPPVKIPRKPSCMTADFTPLERV